MQHYREDLLRGIILEKKILVMRWMYHIHYKMGRKLQGRLTGGTGKGLKGALVRHELHTKSKNAQRKASVAQKEQQELKAKSMKSGGGKSKKQQRQQQQQNKGLNPFTADSTVLLIGEGDFSYARALIQENIIRPENLIATSFDSKKELIDKYPNVEEILKFLEDEGVIVLHEIDANDLVQSLKIRSNAKKPKSLFPTHKNLNFIMFNFPHTGRGMKDVDRNIRDHQKLILNYVRSCKQVFQIVNNPIKDDFGGYSSSNSSNNDKDGKIIITLFEGEPYNSWGIKIIGRSENLRVERSGRLDWEMFPGYHHKRTNGVRDTTKPAAERDARMYVFDKFIPNESKKKAVESDSDDD